VCGGSHREILQNFSPNSKRICLFAPAIELKCEPGKVSNLEIMYLHGFFIETAPPQGGNITLSYLDVSINCPTLSPVENSKNVLNGPNTGLPHTFVNQDVAYISTRTNHNLYLPKYLYFHPIFDTCPAAVSDFEVRKFPSFLFVGDYFQLTLNCSEISPVLAMCFRQLLGMIRARRPVAHAATVRILYEHR